MELLLILLLPFVGVIRHGAHAADCSNFQFSPGNITTPGYPEVEDEYICTSHLSFQTDAEIHVINITDIKLFYKKALGGVECTISFRVGEYNAPCPSTEKECIVYYNNDECKEIITKSYSTCKSYKTLDNKVEVTVASNGDAPFIHEHSKGVEMNYKHVTCPSEISTTSTTTTPVTFISTTTTEQTTTTTKAKTTTTRATSTSSTAATTLSTTAEELTTSVSEQKGQSTILVSTIQPRSNSTSPGHGSSNQNDVTIIVSAVCSVLILILILAIVTVLVLRRRKMRKCASTGENVYRNAIENGTAETVYSAAYGNFAHGQSNPPNQDNLYSFAAPDQSEIATYSTLDHEFGQSNQRNQDTLQSENENAYSSLNHDQRVNQSSHGLTAVPQEVEMYSTIGREPEFSNTNGIPSRKVTVRYKAQPTVDEDVSPSREMVENVLYGAR